MQPFSIDARRQPHSVFRVFCACLHNLSVSGPLDLCLVIQVIQRPYLILNACVPYSTSLAEDMALPRGQYTPYPYSTSRAENQTLVIVGEVMSAIHYTAGPAFIHE